MKKSFTSLIFLSFFNTSVCAFENVVSFGDSLSDGGALDFLNSKTRYISGDNSLLYNEIISLNYTNKYLTVSTEGGNNYSLSGATASKTPLLIYKTENQINEYLNRNNGKANKDDLYLFWAGANDITADVEMSLLTLNFKNLFNDGVNYQLSDAPVAVARQVGTLLDKGAGLVVVPNLPNAGLSPWTATALFGFSQMLLGGNLLDLPSLYKIQDQSLRQEGNVYGEEQRQEAIINSLSKVLNNYGLQFPHQVIANVYRTLLSMENRLTVQFNHDLESSLSSLTGNIAYIDSYSLFQEMIDHPTTYGFDNILVPTCQIGVGAPFCDPSHPTWHNDQTYLFSDWFHPSPEAHAIIAQYITALVNAPMMVSQLAEPVRALMLGQNSFLMSQLSLFRQNKVNSRPYQLFGGYQGQSLFSSSTRNQSRGQSNIGIIIQANNALSVGGALSVGQANRSRLSPYLHTRFMNKTMSVFAQLLLGQSWLSTQVSMGDIKFDEVKRIIPLGKALRAERSTTKGNHFSGSINAGYDFLLNNNISHGPHASVLYRKGKINGFTEKTSTSSSMMFSRHRFSDSYLSTGWHFSWKKNRFNPFLEINYLHPLYTKQSAIKASLKTTDTKFSTEIKNSESSNVNIKLGAAFNINNRTQAYTTVDFPKLKNGLSDAYYVAGLNFTF
ncbi:autotransporter domain-containing protein [Rosenbergiella australiborealis]|uniref:Autotransporter domain-containing protein n=1 Tax=Rosenbergiella australiborealis TaxID=1544696 RepID=A0ABS5T708_9GAMM|nr:autotransporter domain-containing protein [Rosenbergiella australiborealis]MBT0727902.1 autotransporter domain-containing protein [Rosenbergiella australiborealis]